MLDPAFYVDAVYLTSGLHPYATSTFLGSHLCNLGAGCLFSLVSEARVSALFLLFTYG